MRVKRGVKARRRRKRIFEVASGFRGRSGNTIRQGRGRADKALTYMFRDRKQKKRQFRALWITRIGAAARLNGISYSQLMHGLKKANIVVDRKILADLGARHPEAFAKIAEQAKAAL